MKIMVCDDEKIIVEGIVKHISRMTDLNAQVSGACSGQKALDAMEYLRPDLLITDILMPDMDGLALIAEAEKRGLCSRCLILTAYERFEYAQKALDYNVIGYLVKPIDWPELDMRLYALQRQLEGHSKAENVLAQHVKYYSHLETEQLSLPLKKAVRYLKKNYARDPSLTQLSIYTGLSESYLCTLFKNELDITFLDYVNELRLYNAMKLLLEDSGRSVKEIAIMVGYRSERQVFRLFHTVLGITPQQFREQHG